MSVRSEGRETDQTNGATTGARSEGMRGPWAYPLPSGSGPTSSRSSFPGLERGGEAWAWGQGRASRRLDHAGGASRSVLDSLTMLACHALGVPAAIITLVGTDRQVFLSVHGLKSQWAMLGETPIEYSLCRHVAATGQRIAIRDTRSHPLAAGNPLVFGAGIRAYAGSPICSWRGECLGAFAVLGFAARDWSARDLEILDDLARAAAMEIARAPHASSRRDPGEQDGGPPALPGVEHVSPSEAPAPDASASSDPRMVVGGNNRLLRFWRELQERRVVRVAVVYVGMMWLVISVTDVLSALWLPDIVLPILVLIAALGLPVAIATAWAFDLTPTGIMRTD